MNKEQDYASDSDESDEDFRPDQAGESAVSEEESGGSGNEEEHTGEGEASTKPKNVRRNKKLTKKTSKKKTAKSEDSDESDEDETVDNVAAARRSTRQCDESHVNGKGKQLEKNELESDEEDKTRTSALWADFLNDVGPSTKKVDKSNVSEEKPSSSRNGKDNASKATEKLPNGQAGNTRTKEETKKVTVTEVLDFAGEEVRVQREIDASSIKENKATATAAPKLQPFGRIMPGAGIKRSAPAAGSSAGGLGSILNQIGKKKKISVLEKSQMDWKSFKQDEGIDEQLQTFNKGKDGYLERQDFLQRTDLRQFEIEKNMRQTNRRPL